MDRKTLMDSLREGMNQSELAQRLGVNQSTVSRLSDESYQPRQGVIAALIREFPGRANDILSVFLGVNIADAQNQTCNGNGRHPAPAPCDAPAQ